MPRKPLTSILRARVPEHMQQRMEALLEQRGHGQISDLVRDAVAMYLETEEQRLGKPDSPPPYYAPKSPAAPIPFHPDNRSRMGTKRKPA